MKNVKVITWDIYDTPIPKIGQTLMDSFHDYWKVTGRLKVKDDPISSPYWLINMIKVNKP